MIDEASLAETVAAYSDAERDEWLLKGTPEPKDEPESAAGEEEEQDRSGGGKTPESNAPAADTGNQRESKPSGRGEQRKAELGAEIQELLRQRAELRREIDAAKPPAEKTAEVSAAAATAKPEDGKPVPPDPTKWTGTWEELETAKIKYFEDLVAWNAGKGERDRAAGAQQNEMQELRRGYGERAVAYAKDEPDFAAAQDAIGTFATARGMDRLLLASEHGPELVMELYRLPVDEAKRVINLSTPELAAYIGRLEGKLAAGKPAAAAATGESTPPPKRTTTAKPPAREVQGGNAPATGDEAEAALAQGDIGRYMEIMNARDAKKGRG